MLIVDADIHGAARTSVRIENGRIAALGELRPEPGEEVLEARGGALLPGLHDHHLHLMSYAASLTSVACGPPSVRSEAGLKAALGLRQGGDTEAWIRGIGYHESVAGDIDRHWLDRHGPAAPVRVQHRSGRLWIFNTRALMRMGIHPDRWDDGRRYDQDALLRAAIGATLPPIGEASRQLATYGVTGMTDMTPHNTRETLTTFIRLRDEGALRQRLRVAGVVDLPAVSERGVSSGETKVHLHETDLPPFDALCQTIDRSHARARGVAVHCVTEAELVFALAAFREVAAQPGDRIEHASVTPPALLEQIRELGLTVVTQPNFVTERGDAYRSAVPAAEHDWLYRCRAFLEAGIPLAGGTDAPFGQADPWLAMQAAVSRRTGQGEILGCAERLTPEQALALFTGRPEAPAQPRRIAPGEVADLCLLTLPWARARTCLSSALVRATIMDGDILWRRGESVHRGA